MKLAGLNRINNLVSLDAALRDVRASTHGHEVSATADGATIHLLLNRDRWSAFLRAEINHLRAEMRGLGVEVEDLP